ncbi:MAG: hypothetical protein A2944_00740, partial [Candidatus Zambryskibacteria bacterium RIFCSPLOWO2_01_FULL_52_12]
MTQKKILDVASATLPLFDDFMISIKANNYSKETIYNYQIDLEVFSLFLKHEVKIPFEKVEKRTIELFKAYLNSRDRLTASGEKAKADLSSNSINRTLTTLRRYLSYLVDMDEPTPIVSGSVKLLRMGKKHKQVAELKELTQLIECPMKFEEDKLVALRNRAALETLFASGMRISELISLKISQLDKSGRIFIQGKGKKQRFIYLTDRAKKHIDNYLKERTDDLPYLFPAGGRNSGDKAKHISPNYLQMKIKKYRELLGINVPTSAHSLRHGFATYLAESGANPAAIQIL